MYKIIAYDKTETGIQKRIHGNQDKLAFAIAHTVEASKPETVCVSVLDEAGTTVYQRMWAPYCVNFEQLIDNVEDEPTDVRRPENPIQVYGTKHT